MSVENLRFDLGNGNKQYDICHEFMKTGLGANNFTFYVPLGRLKASVEDVDLVLDRITKATDGDVSMSRLGVEYTRCGSSNYFTEHHVFGVACKEVAPDNTINLVCINIARWLFQGYTYKTTPLFVSYIRDHDIDPLKALLMAQTVRYNKNKRDYNRIIVDALMRVPNYLSISQFKKKARGKNCMRHGFQKMFTSEVIVETTEHEEIKKLLKKGKVDEFVEYAKGLDLWKDEN